MNQHHNTFPSKCFSLLEEFQMFIDSTSTQGVYPFWIQWKCPAGFISWNIRGLISKTISSCHRLPLLHPSHSHLLNTQAKVKVVAGIPQRQRAGCRPDFPRSAACYCWIWGGSIEHTERFKSSVNFSWYQPQFCHFYRSDTSKTT